MAVTEINITASGGGNIPCMAAFPSGGPATAVVAVPSIFGVNDDMAMVAERLAGEGYIAIIPDPFWRDEDSGDHRPRRRGPRPCIRPHGTDPVRTGIRRCNRRDQ